MNRNGIKTVRHTSIQKSSKTVHIKLLCPSFSWAGKLCAHYHIMCTLPCYMHITMLYAHYHVICTYMLYAHYHVICKLPCYMHITILYAHYHSCSCIAGIISSYWSYKICAQKQWKLNAYVLRRNEEFSFRRSTSDDMLQWNKQDHFFKTILSGVATIQSLSTKTCVTDTDMDIKQYSKRVPSCPPQIPHYLSWDLTWISKVTNLQLITYQMLRLALLFSVRFLSKEICLEHTYGEAMLKTRVTAAVTKLH